MRRGSRGSIASLAASDHVPAAQHECHPSGKAAPGSNAAQSHWRLLRSLSPVPTSGRVAGSFERDSPEAQAVRRFYQVRADTEHSAARAADLALRLRAIVTWQQPRESAKWLAGGLYSIMVLREVCARLSALSPMSLLATAALVALVTEHAPAVWMGLCSAMALPLQVLSLPLCSLQAACSPFRFHT